MSIRLPDVDALFAAYFTSNDNANENAAKTIRPDLERCPDEVARESTIIEAEITDLRTHLKAEWPSSLIVRPPLDMPWLDAFDRYWTRSRIRQLLEGNPELVRTELRSHCGQLGTAFADVLTNQASRLVWHYREPFWESVLYDPAYDVCVNIFHWAIKRFSDYGADDESRGKVLMAVNLLRNGWQEKPNVSSGGKVHLALPPDWTIGKPQAPTAYATCTHTASGGELTLSLGLYSGGKKPDSSFDGLIQSASHIGQGFTKTTAQETNQGLCTLGVYGTAIFLMPDRRTQVWLVSNGRDLIFAYYDGLNQPPLRELAQAQSIIDSMRLKS